MATGPCIFLGGESRGRTLTREEEILVIDSVGQEICLAFGRLHEK